MSDLCAIHPGYGKDCDLCEAANASTSAEATSLNADQQYAMRMFLAAVNRVTAPHRHGMIIRQSALDNLANRQLEIEKMLGI